MQKDENVIEYCRENERVYYLDLLRAIACLSVIMIHTSAKYVVINFGTFDFWVGNILDSVSRIGVPIFVMISGSLFLDENYSFTFQKYKSHIVKMIRFFVFWSVLYCIVFQIIKPMIHNPASIKKGTILISLLKGSSHLWFVYMLIGLYLIVPILRLWVKKVNRNQIHYFIILSLIFTFFILQVIMVGSYYSLLFQQADDIMDMLNIRFVGGYTYYFILGWYIRFFEIKHKRVIYLLGILSIVFEVVMTYVLSSSLNRPVQLYDNLSLNVMFQSCMVFILCKDRKASINRLVMNKVMHCIVKYSLGIYAIQSGVISLTYSIIEYNGIHSAVISIPIVYLTAFFISLGGAILFGKITILKKYVM